MFVDGASARRQGIEPRPAPSPGWEARALAAAEAYADVLGEFTPVGPDGVSSSFVMAHDRCHNRITAGRIVVNGSWDAHATWADDGARSGHGWMAAHTEVSRPVAHSELRVARALRTMPGTETAFRAGTIGYGKVRLLADAATALPDQFAQAESFLITEITKLRVDQSKRFLDVWCAYTDPDTTTDNEEKLRERRGVHLSETFNGMWRIDGELDPESGHTLNIALTHLCDQIFRAQQATADTDNGVVGSTPSQRRADALVEMARMAMANETNGSGQAVPSAIIILDAERLCDPNTHDGDLIGETDLGTPVTATTGHRMCCDAAISRIRTTGRGVPVDLGTTERFPSPAMRRAMRVRDHGCTFPGCDRPHPWTHAHHIIHWEHNGPTSLANLTSLCSHHHHLVHEGGFGLQRQPDGALCFTRPNGTRITTVKGNAPPPLPGWPTQHPHNKAA